ncbi:MAG TPA: hypothetical protein VGI45_20925 [Terracidiphilus sp.]|jgi:hypothetical protein
MTYGTGGCAMFYESVIGNSGRGLYSGRQQDNPVPVGRFSADNRREYLFCSCAVTSLAQLQTSYLEGYLGDFRYQCGFALRDKMGVNE